MLNKIKAICNFKEMNINDLEKINDNIFTIGNEEYYVLTDEEAQEIYEEMQKDIINDLGLEAFTPRAKNYIMNNCINIQWFNEYMEEYFRIIIDDYDEEALENEYDCYEVNNVEDLLLAYLDDHIEQYLNGLYWYKEYLGANDNEITTIIEINDLLDIDKVIAYCQEADGRGHTIASYDGEENIIEIDNIEYYIYRLN